MKQAIIIGAGPAGLTAAYELLTRAGVHPVVLEQSGDLGGLSRTSVYKGNRIDIGGHRFFSKSDRVMNWWFQFLPLEAAPQDPGALSRPDPKPSPSAPQPAPDPETTDRVMLVRRRRSRIYFLRKFFDYPISFSLDTVAKLGFRRVWSIGWSYLRASLFPLRPEQNLEQFFINRFGRVLYRTFFKSYTEKVWGTPCSQISAAWGAQRIKGLSVTRAFTHAARQALFPPKPDLRQKQTETSLIERFLYPKFGPGQMWEEVAGRVKDLGGEIHLRQRVVKICREADRISAVETVDADTGVVRRWEGDFFFSSMPVKDLVRAMSQDVPANVAEVGEGLVYRDFITVGLLLNRLKVNGSPGQPAASLPDTWIYIQEPDVLLGRLQVFNNWSPYLVRRQDKVWLGLEYFCNCGDGLWSQSDAQIIDLAKNELEKIGIIDSGSVEDATVIRVEKTYPAYFGTYPRFGEIRSFLDKFDNLFLVGRNGMHRYNNQDHSVLTSMTAVDNIIAGRRDKANLWSVNNEESYHEG